MKNKIEFNFIPENNWEKLFPNERIRVYKNLHRDCYSILRKYYDPEKKRYSWLVWDYLTELTLERPKFIVREGGRQRVIKERKKNVHAFIEGTFSDEIPPKFRQEINTKVKYNPYKYEKFYFSSNNEMIDNQDHIFSFVYLSEDGVYI